MIKLSDPVMQALYDTDYGYFSDEELEAPALRLKKKPPKEPVEPPKVKNDDARAAQKPHR